MTVGCPTAWGDPAESSAHQAAQERANRAAARLSDAQTALAKAQEGLDTTQADLSDAEARITALRAEVQGLALNAYLRGGEQPLFLFNRDINELSRARALLRFVTIGTVDSIDRYRVARDDLVAVRSRLSKSLKERQAAIASLRDEQKAAVDELSRLAAAEKAEAERQAKAQQAAAAAAASAGRAPAGDAAATTSTTAAKGTKASGVIASGSWICPVQGPHSFTDDYGAPRGQGPHQGNDILSPRGTPVVANVAGSFNQHPNGLGGNAYYLNGDDGKIYYGAHLDSFSGAAGHVSAGTVLGYVGNTGDAAGGPTHLHFEIHVGGVAVDPYPTLKQYC